MSLSDAITDAKKHLLELRKLTDSELTYVFQRTSNTVEYTADDASPEEITKINAYLSSYEFISNLIKEKGSNSVLEDIEAIIASTLTKTDGPKAHEIRTKVTLKSDKKSKPRDEKGRFFSLTNLMALINNSLEDKVHSNMGHGLAKSILNYRTGTFSGSVKVTKLILNRDDTISAFYTYMKYPYETFAPGFAQGHIASRDPNILIRKSIRQVAKDLVTNRLKVTEE
jgi:hypothetical protein